MDEERPALGEPRYRDGEWMKSNTEKRKKKRAQPRKKKKKMKLRVLALKGRVTGDEFSMELCFTARGFCDVMEEKKKKKKGRKEGLETRRLCHPYIFYTNMFVHGLPIGGPTERERERD